MLVPAVHVPESIRYAVVLHPALVSVQVRVIVCDWRNASSGFKRCEVVLEISNNDLKSDLFLVGMVLLRLSVVLVVLLVVLVRLLVVLLVLLRMVVLVCGVSFVMLLPNKKAALRRPVLIACVLYLF